MQTIPVTSSLLSAAAYDEARQELLLTFKSGATWAYGGPGQPFTPEDLAEFQSAGSQGKHFLQSIKGQWPERRV